MGLDEPLKLKLLSFKKQDNLKYLNGYQLIYQDKKGQQREWELISRGSLERVTEELLNGHNFTDGSMIFATDHSRETVVLLKEFRISANKYVYMLPAGLIDPNEDPALAAVREFKEETGMTFDLQYLDRSQYVSIGIIDEQVNVAYGYYSGTPSAQYQDDNEQAEILILKKYEVLELLKTESFCIRSAMLIHSFFGTHPFLHTKK